jgi:ornithine cyclodeaminase/alanine dehydrogenase-like protein (mu-crystallin family)
MSAPPGTVPSLSKDSKLLAIVNAAALAEMISLPEAIELVSLAMQELSTGLVNAPERSVLPVVPNGRLALMPGTMTHIARFGIKTLSIFSPEARSDLPSHQGVMLLFDSDSGQLLCAIDSHAITALRTAAATAVATRALSQPKSRSLALLGCGSLALLHVQALMLVRPIENIYVWSRSEDKAKAFARQCAEQVAANVRPIAHAREAVEQADIVCTLSASATPILEGRWLKGGQHLNLVGASTRASREVDDEAVVRGYYVADSRAHALAQAGELRHAIESSRVGSEHIAAEIGEILTGSKLGRTSPSMITVYKSLGHIAQDIRVADAVLARLDSSQHVVRVPWTGSGDRE